MRAYKINYKNGHQAEVEVADRADLLKSLFDNSEEKLKSEVSLLTWSTSHMFFTEDPSTGETTSQINSADVNMYSGPKAKDSIKSK